MKDNKINIMKIQNLILILFLIFSFISYGQIDRSKPPKSGPAPVISLGKPKTFTLKNGMKVLVVENNKLPRAYANLSIDNKPDYEGKIKGVSSLVSSLMGNGTKNQSKDDFNEEIDYMGATLSLSASGGYVSSLKRYFPRGLEMMADGLINPIFSEEEFDKEKNILIDNVKSYEKSVQDIADRVNDKLVYGGKHPYGEFVTIESINNIGLEDVNKYYETFAKPNNAYLIIVGDVDFEEIKKSVTKLFSKWKKGNIVESNLPESLDLDQPEINFVNMPNAVQSEIYVNNLIRISMSHPDFFALKLANQILGGSATARLFMNLREDKGFTYGSYSSASTSRYISSFSASASVRNEVTDSSVVEIIKEINKIRNENVSEEELAGVKETYVGSFIMSTERPSTIAGYALNIDKFNLPQNFYETYLENFQKVTVDDIKRVANKYFLADNLRIVVVGKGSEILENLEKLPYRISYYDTYGDQTARPDFSKPTGITKSSILNKYFEAIGGKEKLEKVNALMTMGEAVLQGGAMTLNLVTIQAKPNKLSVMMLMMGNIMMKQVFNGEDGYIMQQGQKIPFPEEEKQKLISSSLPFEELGWIDDENVTFSSVSEEDGSKQYVLKIDDKTTVFFDAETGLKTKQVTMAPTPEGSISPQPTIYEEYRDVDGILFPHLIKIPFGPQTLEFNTKEIQLNPAISDSDFN